MTHLMTSLNQSVLFFSDIMGRIGHSESYVIKIYTYSLVSLDNWAALLDPNLLSGTLYESLCNQPSV